MRFQGRIAVASIAIASFIIILAVAISSGFRYKIREGIASISGDISIVRPDMNYLGEDSPIARNPKYLSAIDSIPGIREIVPVVYRAGIIKIGDNIQGAIFKGTPGGGDSLRVSIPSKMSRVLGVGVGDDLLVYFVGESVKARKFRISSVYDNIISTSDYMIVYAGLEDMQRLNGWGDDEISAMEIILDGNARGSVGEIADEVGSTLLFSFEEDEDHVIAYSSARKYSQIFSWLELIDFNVVFVLILMIVVAGFNMISSLLIMLFRNISMIGTLKSLGMTDRTIAAIFMKLSAGVVAKGIVIGNALALLFCLIQGTTGLIHLNPENYFVSSVPVHVNILLILLADAVSFVSIVSLLLIPCLFVSRVDPATTVRTR